MTHLPRSVLFVEHDSALRAEGAAALRGAGFRVQTAFDGAHALLLFTGSSPDLVIADMMLPEVSGFQLLYAIKDTIRIPARVMMTSEFGSSAHREYAFALGADAFLVKPYSLADLIHHAKRICYGVAEPAPSPAPIHGTQLPSCASV